MSIRWHDDPTAPPAGSTPIGRRMAEPHRRSSAKRGEATLPGAAGGGEMSAREARDFVGSQIAYENMADDEDIAARAIQFVQAHRQRYVERTEELRDKWRTIWLLLRGYSLTRHFTDSDVHIPELYKAVEALVPRIEQAILAYDPWFTVVGRDEIDRVRAGKIEAFMRYQLRSARFDHLIQPAIRTALAYGFVAIKQWWDVETQWRVSKNTTRQPDGSYRVERKEEEVVVYNGPRFAIVDPLDFFIDPFHTETRPGTFIGDRCRMTLEELRAGERLGIYKNIDAVAEMSSTRGKDITSFDRQLRSLELLDVDQQMYAAPPGAPERYEVTEVWGLFDPYGRGEAREYVITTVNDRVAIRVQENPRDDKRRPYAICRFSKEAFEFHGVGPLDHAVRLNIELDDHENLALKGQALSICPHVWVRPGSDVPDSVFHLEPGTVIQASGDIQWNKPPSILGDFLALKNSLRLDIEETVGVPRIYEGTRGGNTATEVERKIQEANRRTKNLILAFSKMLEDVLVQLHGLNQQWVGRETKFRVLGRAAKGLNTYELIGPDELATEIDFEFQGLAGLESQGLRATQLAAFMNQAGAVAALVPGTVNWPAVIRQYYDSLGLPRPGDDIIRVPEPFEEAMRQEDENVLLASGTPVPVSMHDDDEEHIARLDEVIFGDAEVLGRRFEEMPDDAKRRFLEHRVAHEQQAYAKALRQRSQPTDAAAFPQAQAGVDPGRGTTGNRAQDLSGKQVPPNRTPPGVTPGPERPEAVGAPDRYSGIFQNETQT